MGLGTIIYIHCTYIPYFSDVCFSPILTCVVLFSLYAHGSYYFYTIYYFCFTQRCLDEFCLKCFKKTGCQSRPCHKLSSCKIFQEFMLRLDLLYSTSDYEFSDL